MTMPRTSVSLLAAGLALGAAAPLDGRQAEARSDSEAIDLFWTALDSVWADRDPGPFVRLFTPDASFAVVDRDLWLEGSPALLRHFTEQFRNQRPELRHVTEVTHLRPLASGVTALDGEVRVVDTTGNRAVDFRRLAITAVMVEAPDGWRVRMLRAYTLPPRDAPAGDP
jgi:uncharacterized protein (TIGR02246 family)